MENDDKLIGGIWGVLDNLSQFLIFFSNSDEYLAHMLFDAVFASQEPYPLEDIHPIYLAV